MKRVRAHRGDHTADVLVEAIQAHGTRGELAEVLLGGLESGVRIVRLDFFSFDRDRAHETRPSLTLDKGRETSVVVVESERVRGVLVLERQYHRVRRLAG